MTSDLARPARILVVDDELDVQLVLRKRLESAGYEVETAATGHEALLLANERQPDLVLLDLMLPGIDGFSVCMLLKRDPKLRSTPVLILTARSQPCDLRTGETVGADGYLTKPFSSTELLDRIQDLLSHVARRINGQPAPSETVA